MSNMVEVTTGNLTGAALDWLLANIEAIEPHIQYNAMWQPNPWIGYYTEDRDFLLYEPSANWAQTGPLIDKYDVSIANSAGGGFWASAKIGVRQHGDTRLTAACRAIIAAQIGESVQVPQELAP